MEPPAPGSRSDKTGSTHGVLRERSARRHFAAALAPRAVVGGAVVLPELQQFDLHTPSCGRRVLLHSDTQHVRVLAATEMEENAHVAMMSGQVSKDQTAGSVDGGLLQQFATHIHTCAAQLRPFWFCSG